MGRTLNLLPKCNWRWPRRPTSPPRPSWVGRKPGPLATFWHVQALLLLTSMMTKLLPLAGLLALLVATNLTAQGGPGSGEGDVAISLPVGIAGAAGASDLPVIDGRLDDAAWAQAAPMTGFIQREPDDGQPASERTEVRVLFDDAALYVGVWAFDSRPAEIVPGERIRDYDVDRSDNIVLIIDTYRDEQNGFVFGTTPAGIEYDGQVANEGQGGGRFGGGGRGGQNRFQEGAGGGFNKNWDGGWTVATSLDGQGWYAEFRIPFNTLRYGTENPSWGFNVSRRIRRLNEESFWSPVPREFNLYRLNYAGDLQGLAPPFRRLATVTPYVLGTTARNYEGGDTHFEEDGDFGGEAKIQVTQGLTLDATVNTDFAQVEVDNQQVNLTRFSLLFPEKRPFFLENAGFFTVGARGADLFFSRNIGIIDGEQVPIKGGGRVSGKAAGLNIGLLHIQTDGADGLQPGNSYSVARVARELPNRSRVGALFIDRNGETSSDYNRTYAADARVSLGEAVTLTSFVAQTETPGLTDAELAWDGNAAWSSRNWEASVGAREIGENFNPEVGFVPRDGHLQYSTRLQRFIRPDGFLREIRPHMSFDTYRSRRTGVEKGFEESSRLHLDSHWEWPDGMVIFTTANWVLEGLYEPFEIRGTDVVVPVGTYDGWEGNFIFNTNSSADLSLNSGLTFGSFLSGNRWNITTGVTLRSGAAFSTSINLDYNNVDLPEGSFETTLVGLNIGYFFTPRIYLQSLIQYSDQIDRFSANARFGWLNTAGTGLFIVYNEIQGIDELDGPLGRSLTLKYTRQFNVLGG